MSFVPLETERKSKTNIFSSSADIIIIITLDHHESGDGPVIKPDRGTRITGCAEDVRI